MTSLAFAAGAAWVIALRVRVRHQTRVIRAALEHEADTGDRYRDLFGNIGDAV